MTVGYTSFAWVVVLDGVWRLTGVQPPDSANWLSLGQSALTLLQGSLMALRLNWSAKLRPFRVFFLGLLLILVLTNRTILAWTSSGLETALFNLVVTAWVFTGLCQSFGSRPWLAGPSTTAALAYLTRPEGLLLAAITLALVGLAFRRLAHLAALRLSHWACTARLLAIPLHVGWRYALLFIIEYALWIWPDVLVVLLLQLLRRRSRPADWPSGPRRLTDAGPAKAGVIAPWSCTGCITPSLSATTTSSIGCTATACYSWACRSCGCSTA